VRGSKFFKKGQNKYIISEKMKANFRLVVGVIVIAIGFAILVSMVIVGSITPDYNYASYNGFRVPDWLGYVASLIIFAHLFLVIKGINQ